MVSYRNNSHSVSNLCCHIVWATKYRYHVLQGDFQSKCRDNLIHVCDSGNVQILKGVVSKDHIHMHIEYPPSLSISVLVKKLKGHSSRLLQQEFPELSKRNWGRHFWSVGYGVWSTGNITDEMVQEYLEHHRDKPNSEKGNWIIQYTIQRISFFSFQLKLWYFQSIVVYFMIIDAFGIAQANLVLRSFIAIILPCINKKYKNIQYVII